MKKLHFKVDKFTIILVAVLIACAVMLIISFRRIFGAFTTAYDVSSTEEITDLKVNEAKLQEAFDFAFGEKKTVSLKMKDSAVPSVTLVPTPKL